MERLLIFIQGEALGDKAVGVDEPLPQAADGLLEILPDIHHVAYNGDLPALDAGDLEFHRVLIIAGNDEGGALPGRLQGGGKGAFGRGTVDDDVRLAEAAEGALHRVLQRSARGVHTVIDSAAFGGLQLFGNDVCHIQCLLPDEILTEEPKLLKRAYETIARLPFARCDVLVVDRIGKNISGDGMDPNVTGRFCTPYASGGIQAEKVVVLGLTPETHGNAQGMGLADCTTRRLAGQMKLEATYPTGVTNTFLHLMKIPMVMDNDREAVQLALCCCPEAEDQVRKKLIRIPDTAHIEYMEISEGLLPQALANPRIEVLEGPYDWSFDAEGNLF